MMRIACWRRLTWRQEPAKGRCAKQQAPPSAAQRGAATRAFSLSTAKFMPLTSTRRPSSILGPNWNFSLSSQKEASAMSNPTRSQGASPSFAPSVTPTFGVDVEKYWREGYLLAPAVVTPEHLARLRAESDRLIAHCMA